MNGPIYESRGKAKEYCDLALNIYNGCPHRCFYCFAPLVLRKDREEFHSVVEPRVGIVMKVARQLERERITGKTIHLCFTCDPYPSGYDTTPTRKIINLLKEYGNHIQILTKGDGKRDFDLLDGDDWYGVTIDGSDGGKDYKRGFDLLAAHNRGIKTWVSFEPVINPKGVMSAICALAKVVDKVKIGKLNYHPSNINWAEFGREAEALCQELGVDYYIKESLRAEMEANT